MILSYKIELRPNKNHVKQFRLNAGVARHAYNWALEKHSAEYELYKIRGGVKPKINAYAWQKQFVIIKNQSDWMSACSKWTPQVALINLQKSFERLFKNLGCYPKRKDGRIDSFTVRSTSVGYDYILLPKIGKVKIKRKGFATLQEIPVSYITITREADKWFATFYIKGQEKIPKQLPQLTNISEQDIVGVDLGVKDLAITSDSQVFSNPKSYKKYKKKLARIRRKLSRQKKGSKNRNKTKTKFQRLHYKIKNIRKDASNKMTSSITKSSPKMLVIETLKPRNMSKNHKLAGSILDAAFGEIVRQFNYKCELNGIHLIKVPQFYPSSQFCSCCGSRKKDLKLSDREWTCLNCGVEHDRDFNASKNLHFFGEWLLLKYEKENTEGYSGIYACGDERLQFLTGQCSSVKQEFLKLNCKYLTI